MYSRGRVIILIITVFVALSVIAGGILVYVKIIQSPSRPTFKQEPLAVTINTSIINCSSESSIVSTDQANNNAPESTIVTDDPQFTPYFFRARDVVERYLSALVGKDFTNAQSLLVGAQALSRVNTLESQDYINNMLTGFEIQKVGVVSNLRDNPRGTYQVRTVVHFQDEPRGIAGERKSDYYIEPLPPGDFFISDVEHGNVKITSFLPSVRYIPVQYVSAENGTVMFTKKDGSKCNLKIYEPNEMVFITSWSPNGKFLLVQHFNEERGYGGPFGPTQTGLVIISTDSPHTVTELIQAGKGSQTEFHWSPDGRYFSYVMNQGEAIEIVDTQNKRVVLRLPSNNSEARPLTWLDSQKFSFALDRTAYTGTLSNPKGKIVATDVENSICMFESPAELVALDWSLNRENLAYLGVNSLVFINVPTGQRFTIGSLTSDEGYCGAMINTSSLGWSEGNKHYVIENLSTKSIDSSNPTYVSLFSSIRLPDGVRNKYQRISSDMEKYNVSSLKISRDGMYAIGIGAALPDETDKRPWITIVYSLQADQQICQLDGPAAVLVDRNGDWENGGYALITYDSALTYKILNLSTCKPVGQFRYFNEINSQVKFLDPASLPTISELVTLYK